MLSKVQSSVHCYYIFFRTNIIKDLFLHGIIVRELRFIPFERESFQNLDSVSLVLKSNRLCFGLNSSTRCKIPYHLIYFRYQVIK